MSEQNKSSLDKDQSIPKIEDEILKRFDGNIKEAALEFVTYLNEHNMATQQ